MSDTVAWHLVQCGEDPLSPRYEEINDWIVDFFIDYTALRSHTGCLRACRLIVQEERLSWLDIASLRPTEMRLATVYEQCEEMFRTRYKTAYYIYLLAFTIKLERYLERTYRERETWHMLHWLVQILTEQLVLGDFDPKTVGKVSEPLDPMRCDRYHCTIV